jgi:hypothetical protein
MSVLRSIPILAFAATISVLASAWQTTSQSPNGRTSSHKADPGTVGRGKKLVLKDGTFQIAREYQRNGERVRYLSAERGDWEEIPAAMVDWEATAKAEAAAASQEDALLKTVRH